MPREKIPAALTWQVADLQRRLVELSSRSGEERMRRSTAAVNSGVWIVGHLTWCKDALINECVAGTAERRSDWDRWFSSCSVKQDASVYPPLGAVIRECERVHRITMERLGRIDAAGRPVQSPNPQLETNLDIVVHFVRDAAYHTGQLSYLLAGEGQS